MNWSNRKISYVILMLLVIVCAPKTLLAQADWNQNNFVGDATFEFRYILPANVDSRLKKAAEIVKGVYDRTMPKGRLGRMKIASAVEQTKKRGDIKAPLNRANKMLSELLDTAPDQYPQAYFIRGTSYMLLGKFSEALADFNSALTDYPANHFSADAAFVVLSFIWDTLSDEQKSEWGSLIASRMAERITIMQRANSHDYILIGKLFYLASDLGKAYSVIMTGLEHDPTDRSLIVVRDQIEAMAKRSNGQ